MKYIILVGMLVVFVSSCAKKVETFEGLIPINGTELYVKVVGEGDPIIFLHGGPGLGFDYFLPQLQSLSNEYKLIFFDQRISGRSSANVSPDSVIFNLFVDDIDVIRDHFGFEKVHILAHSWGNLLAVEYALRYPQHLDKMILSNPVPFNQEYGEEVQQLQSAKIDNSFLETREVIMKSEAFKNRELIAFEKLFMLSFSLSFYDTTNMSEMNFKLFDGFFERNEKMQYFKGLEVFDYYEKFPDIATPTLLIRGVHDLSVREADIKAVEALENARLVEMEFSGHFPFIEQKEEYLWEVRNFLK